MDRKSKSEVEESGGGAEGAAVDGDHVGEPEWEIGEVVGQNFLEVGGIGFDEEGEGGRIGVRVGAGGERNRGHD